MVARVPVPSNDVPVPQITAVYRALKSDSKAVALISLNYTFIE